LSQQLEGNRNMSGEGLKREIFRAYDIRGVVGEDLTPGIVRRIGQAIGTYLGREGANIVILGRDARLSSPELHAAMQDGLLSTGVSVLDIGLVPTPLMYFAIKHFGTDGGVMITASHNPPQFNGIKIRKGTTPLVTDELQLLAELALQGNFSTGQGQLRSAAPIPAYVEVVSSKFRLERPLKVVADFGNGCAGLVAPAVLERIGCQVEPLFAEPDGRFPNHHPDPMKPDNLKVLQDRVRESKADVGLAFDGDGDRLGIVDNLGNIVDPNQFLALLARDMLPRHPGATVISEVKASQMLIEEVERLGGRFVMTRVGYPFILAAMREHGALFGGELSGHYYFNDPLIDFDDATFASCVLASMLSRARRSLAELVSALPQYPATPELVIPCPDERKFAVVDEIKRLFAQRYPIIDIDGARVIYPDGWGVVRASNTEPRLTLRFEGKTEEALARIMAEFREVLQQSGLKPTF
jgi:phosphomannomutase/phosphoglucomutase